MVKSIAMILAAVALFAGGIALGRYAEADDAPGGVVIAVLIMLGAGALGVKGFMGLQQKR